MLPSAARVIDWRKGDSRRAKFVLKNCFQARYCPSSTIDFAFSEIALYIGERMFKEIYSSTVKCHNLLYIHVQYTIKVTQILAFNFNIFILLMSLLTDS